MLSGEAVWLIVLWLLPFLPTYAPADTWQQQPISERSASPRRLLSDGALEATACEEPCAAGH